MKTLINKTSAVNSNNVKQIDYNSRKFKKELEIIRKENYKLLENSQPDYEKMHLRFNI